MKRREFLKTVVGVAIAPSLPTKVVEPMDLHLWHISYGGGRQMGKTFLMEFLHDQEQHSARTRVIKRSGILD